jgi:BCD family chlorophyll transporter-like MFS transporter
MDGNFIGWPGIMRLGLVQAALGAIVVLATSTMNRVMVVELSLPAIVPGALVALHYLIQIARPRFGHGSDQGGRRTPWIVGGMLVLAAGGVGAAAAIGVMAAHPAIGVALATVAFVMIGMGVGASGTSLLVLLAKRVHPGRRAAAASIVWLMMIAGFAITAGTAGRFLDPFSPDRLLAVTACVALIAVVVTLLAVWRIEGSSDPVPAHPAAEPQAASSFREALAQVWAEKRARQFTIFLFVAMLAYNAQELILEPFAGSVFRLTPGETAQLTGLQHAGAFLGMLAVAIVGTFVPERFRGSMRNWTIGGCVGSALSLLGIAFGGFVGPAWPLAASIFVLGAANGVFAVSAIGAMMGLVDSGRPSRAGVRMGLWGAAQAVAFAVGGLFATATSDIAHALLGPPTAAYAAVFVLEAGLFVIAANLAVGVFNAGAARRPAAEAPAGGLNMGVR